MHTNQNFVTEDLLASKGKRFLNHLIDLIPQYAVVYGIDYGTYYLGEFTGYYAPNDYWYNMSYIENFLFNYGLMFLYYFIMEKYTYKTLGKFVTKTLVVTTDGETPSAKHILKRSLSRLIPFDGLSFIGVNGKGWHDSLSKTYVVDIEKFESKKESELELNQIGKLPE